MYSDDKQLTAILVAEGQDAVALTAWSRDCFDPLVGRFGGHVVASGQARLLAEFDGIVDAVNCALAAQRRSVAGPGSVWRHDPGVVHYSEALEDCVQIEIKSPPCKTWTS